MVTIIILVVYIAFVIAIGLYFHRRSVKSVNEFVLGGCSLGAWITAFAYGTSYFSAVIFVGYAGRFGWDFGIASTWIGIGNAIIGSLMAWLIMGRRTRVMTNFLHTSTCPQFFEKRYISKGLKISSAVIIFVFLIPYTASVYNGLSRLFEMAFNVDYSVCVIGMAVITAVYVILGGYKATAYNDFFQGIIMLVGIVAVVAATLASKGGLWTAITELSNVPTEGAAAGLEGVKGGFTSFFGPDPMNLLGVVILTSLGTWGLPQMVHKFYTIKDEHAIKTGTIVSTVFALVVAGGSYFLGGFGRLFVEAKDGLPVTTFDGIIPDMLKGLPEILIGVVVILVLSASMSTLSSLVLTSSSTLTLDLIKPFADRCKNTKKHFNEKRTLICMQLLIGAFLIISVILALNKNALISDLMGYSWGALAGAFLAPFLYGLFWKRVTKASIAVNFVFAITVTMLHMFIKPTGSFLGFDIGSPINLGAATMLVGLIIVPVVSIFTKKYKKADIDKIFSCYKKRVEVNQGDALGETENPYSES